MIAPPAELVALVEMRANEGRGDVGLVVGPFVVEPVVITFVAVPVVGVFVVVPEIGAFVVVPTVSPTATQI